MFELGFTYLLQTREERERSKHLSYASHIYCKPEKNVNILNVWVRLHVFCYSHGFLQMRQAMDYVTSQTQTYLFTS